jgi:hypothetical protein
MLNGQHTHIQMLRLNAPSCAYKCIPNDCGSSSPNFVPLQLPFPAAHLLLAPHPSPLPRCCLHRCPHHTHHRQHQQIAAPPAAQAPWQSRLLQSCREQSRCRGCVRPAECCCFAAAGTAAAFAAAGCKRLSALARRGTSRWEHQMHLAAGRAVLGRGAWAQARRSCKQQTQTQGALSSARHHLQTWLKRAAGTSTPILQAAKTNTNTRHIVKLGRSTAPSSAVAQ